MDQCRLLLASRRTLVLFGAYSIGKERVYLQVGRELGVRIFVERARWRVLECLGLPPEDTAMLTTQPGLTRFRVVPMGHLRLDRLRALLKAEAATYDSVVAFRPTGWCNSRSSGPAGRACRSGNVRIQEVPYSEHSAFNELVASVRDLRPAKIIPTVNGGTPSKVERMVRLLREL